MGSIGPEILTRLLDEHGAALVLYAGQWCDAPEDVVQEAFLALVRQPALPENVVGWIYRVVRNEAINALRSSRRRTKRETVAAESTESWFCVTLDDRLDAAEAAGAMKDLPIEQRETVVARLWGGLSFDEIADLTGASTSTAHRWYQAGLNTLRERLGAACQQRKKQDDLKSFEAALAGLIPRSDRIDRDRLMFLAGQQSVLPSTYERKAGSESVLPSTFGREAGGESLGATAGLSSSDQDAVEQAEHESIFSDYARCFRTAGPASSGTRNKRAWPWPAAFTAMSAIAATLLIILVSRPGSVDVGTVANQQATPNPDVAATVKEKSNTGDISGQSQEYAADYNLALQMSFNNQKINEANSPYSNTALLRQILAEGVDSWKPVESGTYNKKSINTRPLSNRELLNEFLTQPDIGPG